MEQSANAPATVSESLFGQGVPHNEHKVKYHDVILSLLALLIVPTYLYGLRVLILAGSAIATALILDFIGKRIFLRAQKQRHDYSGVVTALCVVMLTPATAPVWVVCVTVGIGLCTAKYPFGGQGNNIFNPAAVGVAFSAICWPEYMLKYPVAYTTYSLTDMTAIQYSDSPASVLRVGGTPKLDHFDILLGNYVGPLGATCMLVLAACMLYLLFRKVISKRIVFSAFAIVILAAIIFPRVVTGRVDSIVHELSSGGLVFGIIFMAGDPTTTPDTKLGRIIYGMLFGALIMLFRHFGKVELAVVYAVLISNVFAHSCDHCAKFVSKKLFGKPSSFERIKKDKAKEAQADA